MFKFMIQHKQVLQSITQCMLIEMHLSRRTIYDCCKKRGCPKGCEWTI